MALIRWEPARELRSAQTDINRLFNTLFATPVTVAQNSTVRRWIPAMDLLENEHNYVLRADLPGVSEDDLKVEFQDNVLTVSGKRSSEHEERREGFHRIERSAGSFSRRLKLPEGIDPQAVTATFDRGVLEIHVPKPQAQQPQRVEIAIGTGAPQASAAANGSDANAADASAPETSAPEAVAAETTGAAA